jgi:hypothetical protein
MTELAVADDLALKRRSTTQLAAELTDNAFCLFVHVDALAHQRSAVAIRAAVAVGGKRADAPAQKEALELLDVYVGGGHAPTFARNMLGPALFTSRAPHSLH